MQSSAYLQVLTFKIFGISIGLRVKILLNFLHDNEVIKANLYAYKRILNRRPFMKKVYETYITRLPESKDDSTRLLLSSAHLGLPEAFLTLSPKA